MKESETKVEKTRFVMGVPISEIRYKEKIKTSTSSCSEEKFIMATNYQLTRDKAKKEII